MDAVPWIEFARAHAPLSRDEFTAVVSAPHLLIPWLPISEESEDPFFTEQLTRDQVSGLRRAGNDLLVVSVRKRQQGNAFSSMITLGRAVNNDLVLPHPGISKFHAYFRQGPNGEWLLRDANSLNGTRVDGVRLPGDRDQVLRPGSVLRLADAVTCEFLPPGELFARLHAEQPLSQRARELVAQAALPATPADNGRATRIMPRQALDPDEETHRLAH